MKLVAASALACCFARSADAQQTPAPRVYTDADYAQAEKFMPYNVNPLVLHEVKDPKWLADGRMVYRDKGAAGTKVIVVDPAKGTKEPAFDQAKLTAALIVLSPDLGRLWMGGFTLADGDKTVLLGDSGSRVRCDLSGAGVCTRVTGAAAIVAGEQKWIGPENAKEEVSPDGKKAVFIRDWNLWLKDLATGKETQLTKDGVVNFGYATDNAGWKHTGNPIVVWSPDSRRIATFQQDQRKTGEMYLTNVTFGHPTLTVLKYPLVGDKDVTMIERVVIDVDRKKVVRLKMPPDQHRSTICDDVSCGRDGGWDDVQWSAD